MEFDITFKYGFGMRLKVTEDLGDFRAVAMLLYNADLMQIYSMIYCGVFEKVGTWRVKHFNQVPY